ncbi:sulfite reductase subunit beta [Aeromicrobium sp. CFBP 8757]|uniref:sulfite reductase subunit beta n=1 Tax=Aeromicrobium sp. CFBP 8757 TaxID=2775288 RepID=UPI0017873FEF|nr:sulfite reductase subunit beta [Aeromicrobium sp. CFBP 8757]MBD8607482.1 sulfite reductase subunit beta [Aeromicrobium sp. CFBP 8757]
MTVRTHVDRCPGVLRPWIAADGAIVRLRLIGGVIASSSLSRLLAIAEEHADGTVLLTKRTNLQLRGIEHADGCVPPALVEALTAAGLLPSTSHELVRNVMVSPLTGRTGGLADLRGTALELDRLLCAEPELARLAGRFLFVLDDGRGDVGHRTLDLGVTAVDAGHAQLRIGSQLWGPVLPLDDVPAALVEHALRFLAAAGTGESAPWHVDELPGQGAELVAAPTPRDVRTQVRSLPLRHGMIAQGADTEAIHLDVPSGLLNRNLVDAMAASWADEVIVTPWRSVIIPDLEVE